MSNLKVISWLNRIKVEFFIISVCIALFIPVVFFSRPVQVGDGSEYYALFLSWQSTGRPFMTDASFTEYSRLVDSARIIGLVGVSELKESFPGLRAGSTADFNHFWFYSLCAAGLAKAISLIGITIPIHVAFLGLHCLLLAGMLIIAWRSFGWKGLIAAGLLTLLSPIVWYSDKVHTEFFTYCVTTSAVILFLKKRYLASALFLALASTQNISFAAVSLLVVGFDLATRKKARVSAGEGILFLLTMGINALHPAYYLYRFGVLDPQLIAGGAEVGSSLRYALIWILDLDLGLMPNWPFGVGLLLLAALALRGRGIARQHLYSWLLFAGGYIGVSLAAQVSTTNLNSGATPGLSRYALWYLALFFPFAWLSVEKMMASRVYAAALVTLVVLGVVFSSAYYHPALSEFGHIYPSPVSYWLQKNLPGVYDPPAEVFAERYGGIGENPALQNARAVLGPDCHKALLINRSLDDGPAVLGRDPCGVDRDKLSHWIKNQLASGVWPTDGPPVYVRLADADIQANKFVPRSAGSWYAAVPGGGAQLLMSGGWYGLEMGGTWSQGKEATLDLPCPPLEKTGPISLAVELDLDVFASPAHPVTHISIDFDREKVWSGALTGASLVRIALPEGLCAPDGRFMLAFHVDNPASPASLGLSSDERMLGIKLKKVRFTASDG